MWRWSQLEKQLEPIIDVFSTYVEVILGADIPAEAQGGILHVCGGDPD